MYKSIPVNIPWGVSSFFFFLESVRTDFFFPKPIFRKRSFLRRVYDHNNILHAVARAVMSDVRPTANTAATDLRAYVRSVQIFIFLYP